MGLFSLRKTFCDLFLSLLFFGLSFRDGEREEIKGGRGGRGEDAWSTFLFM